LSGNPHEKRPVRISKKRRKININKKLMSDFNKREVNWI
jgi:hypothetical protein